MNHWVYNDGGRSAAGFKGHADDCVTRAVAIATGRDYREVYDELFEAQKERVSTSRKYKKRKVNTSPRNGIFKEVTRTYIGGLGWTWTPTMFVGVGTTVHLKADELPGGVVIASVSKHMVTLIDGVIQDTHDPSREGTRAVYGYWTKEN